MTNCTKTGARVYLRDYDVVLPADVYEVGPSTLVFVCNMALFHDRSTKIPKEDITHAVSLGPDCDYFWRKQDGILVVASHLVTTF